ncbi:hypothetical protein ACX6XY_29245 [Streptomyces sp. O3]
MGGSGEVRWNAHTQRWESTAPHRRRPFTAPPPPRPTSDPSAGSEAAGTAGTAGTSWQQVGTAAPGGPLGGPPPRPWRRRAVVVVPVVVAALLAGLGVWLRFGQGDDGQPDATGVTGSGSPGTPPSLTAGAPPDPSRLPSPSSPPSLSPSPSPSLASSPASSGPPPGFQSFTEPEFAIDVPEGWERRTEPGQAGVTVYFYEEPGGGPRFLQVFPVTEEGYTPRKALAVTDEIKRDGPDTGYVRNSLRDVRVSTRAGAPQGPAAELDYSYDSDKWGTRLRVLDRVFHADGDTLYAVLSSGPADEWPTQRLVLTAAVGSFCLPTVC